MLALWYCDGVHSLRSARQVLSQAKAPSPRVLVLNPLIFGVDLDMHPLLSLSTHCGFLQVLHCLHTILETTWDLNTLLQYHPRPQPSLKKTR